MRIALVHSFYRSGTPSGENTVVRSQAVALAAGGHDVIVVARHSDDEQGSRTHPLRAAVTVATGRGADPTAELAHFRPDVVHVHNLFPNWGESWLSRWDGPLVATMHNFRAVCANALLFRDGATCTLCLAPGHSWNAVKYGCYRGSRTGSLPLAIHNSGGVARNRVVTRADQIIVLSQRSQRIFATAGGSNLAKRTTVIPNGLPDRGPRGSEAPVHWAFVGRLTEEKGLREMMAAWPADEPLTVVGDGPLRGDLEAAAPSCVRFLGQLNDAGVDRVLRTSWGLLFPSRCFEGFPTVVGEALMQGTPVVALEGNAGADFVAEHGVGATYTVSGGLGRALADVRRGAHLPTLCRRTYEEKLSLDTWLEQLLAVYVAAGAVSLA